jgi:hypothetical protein
VSDAENRKTIEDLVRALTDNDLELFHAQFQEDSVMHYPQSGERIVGDENRRGAYGAFPQLPKATAKRILVSGDLGVLEASLDYGDGQAWQAVMIFEFRDGKIARETAYWPQPFEAAAWRSQWVETTA